jgi:hypothetical protein
MLDGRSRLLVSDQSSDSPWNRFGVTVNDDDMSSLLLNYSNIFCNRCICAWFYGHHLSRVCSFRVFFSWIFPSLSLLIFDLWFSLTLQSLSFRDPETDVMATTHRGLNLQVLIVQLTALVQPTALAQLTALAQPTTLAQLTPLAQMTALAQLLSRIWVHSSNQLIAVCQLTPLAHLHSSISARSSSSVYSSSLA